MHRLKEKFYKDVLSMTEGQLLTENSGFRINQDSTQTFRIKAIIGRGDIKAFAVNFVGVASSLINCKFTILVNGKEVNADLPAVAYLIDQTGGNGAGLSAGSQRLNNTVFRIPPGAIVEIRTVSGNFNALDVDLLITGYYSTLWIPEKMGFSLIQNFELTARSGSFDSDSFVLPARRGRIVGLSLNINSDAQAIDDPSSGAVLLINGVELHINFMPSRYLISNNNLYTNNWIVNIEGGGVLQLAYNNKNGADIVIGTTLYFSEEIESRMRSEKRG